MEKLKTPNTLVQNAQVITEELKWLSAVIDLRITTYFNPPEDLTDIRSIAPPVHPASESPYSNLIDQLKLGFEERLLLALATAPHTDPKLLDFFFTKNQNTDRRFTEFGGIAKENSGAFLPTLNTALFILFGNDLEGRLSFTASLRKQNALMSKGILQLVKDSKGDASIDKRLDLSAPYRLHLLACEEIQSHSSKDFPAEALTTSLEWDDFYIEENIKEELEEILLWIEHGSFVMDSWQLRKRIKPGYRSLFYGPPGTGKTLAASLIGKMTNREVYRVDLSQVVSKFIGETEKNLSRILDTAEKNNWILFFDEADSLFGKRTNVASSHDRYANQEVSYLMQRIENYAGIVILSTDLNPNINQAFTRRLQSVIHFGLPDAHMRKNIWMSALPEALTFEPSIDISEFADKYELSGESIVNIIRFCALMAKRQGRTTIVQKDLLLAIRREMRKTRELVA